MMEDEASDPAYLAVTDDTTAPGCLAVTDDTGAPQHAAAKDDAAHNTAYHETVEDTGESTAIDLFKVSFKLIINFINNAPIRVKPIYIIRNHYSLLYDRR
jgi:hypothetical protein